MTNSGLIRKNHPYRFKRTVIGSPFGRPNIFEIITKTPLEKKS